MISEPEYLTAWLENWTAANAQQYCSRTVNKSNLVINCELENIDSKETLVDKVDNVIHKEYLNKSEVTVVIFNPQ